MALSRFSFVRQCKTSIEVVGIIRIIERDLDHSIKIKYCFGDRGIGLFDRRIPVDTIDQPRENENAGEQTIFLRISYIPFLFISLFYTYLR